MLPAKTKTTGQKLILRMALNRMRGMPDDLLHGGEPMLANRVSSIISELEIALDKTNKDEYNG